SEMPDSEAFVASIRFRLTFATTKSTELGKRNCDDILGLDRKVAKSNLNVVNS
ncbi:hypothetical protein AVEN_217068-1, partial [Araneus ventricosus]